MDIENLMSPTSAPLDERPPGLDVGQADNPRDAWAEPRRAPKTSERVALDIVQDIAGRGLRTGDRLPLEAAMVEGYGVSRASLREALRLLEVQGLIRMKPGPAGGPLVGTVDPANLARTAHPVLPPRRGHLRAVDERPGPLRADVRGAGGPTR